MASPAPRRPHLDVTPNREVVYCHACESEWYSDEHNSLDCPHCHAEAIEIVTAENDPRIFNDALHAREDPSPTRFVSHHHSDPDPEEADIEEHVTRSPHGLFMQQRVYQSLPPRHNEVPGPNRFVHPADGNAILQRFTDMLLTDFRVGTHGRSGPNHLFPPRNGPQGMFFGGPPRTQRTTFGSGPGVGSGHTTFTTSTETYHSRGGAPATSADFSTVFGNLMNNIPAPNPGSSQQLAQPNVGQSPGNIFAIGLHEILGSLLNPTAVLGDAVYSQEALDRIITNLMEANPQSNAAPPASQSALDELEHKKLDDKMCGSDDKAGCTICIDELHHGDDVVVLPCKHWFHGECVMMWLKEHNTCPICRTPIEGEESGRNLPQSQESARTGGIIGPTPTTSNFLLNSDSRIPHQDRNLRSAQENQQRLNTIRDQAHVAALRSRGDISVSPPLYETRFPSVAQVRSPLQFRDSLRETEPDGRSSVQQPHGQDHTGGGTGGQGPINWLRDQSARTSGSSGPDDSRRP